MSDIITKMQQEIINRSNTFEESTRGTKDQYNIYKEHIQYVYKYAIMLAENKNVDKEVVALSALLHDIAMTDSHLDRAKHNEDGAIMAENLLRHENYPETKIQLIKKCILNHSSKRAVFRTTEEEQILVNADALAHFDSIKDLYSLAHNVMNLNDEESLEFIKNKLTKDYAEISPELQYLIASKYKKIMDAHNLDELLYSQN